MSLACSILRRSFFRVAATAQSFLSGGLSRFAGIDTIHADGDNGPAYYAAFQGPSAVARDAAGNIYIGEIARIRKIDTHGVITTIAGTGARGDTGDGGPATSAEINYVGGIAIDSQGNLYFSEDQVRTSGASLPTEPFRHSLTDNDAAGLAVDSQDQLYVAEPINACVRVIANERHDLDLRGNRNVRATRAKADLRFKPNSASRRTWRSIPLGICMSPTASAWRRSTPTAC